MGREHFQLLGKMFARMNRLTHPSLSSMIINHFNVHRAVCNLRPLEANSPLVCKHAPASDAGGHSNALNHSAGSLQKMSAITLGLTAC